MGFIKFKSNMNISNYMTNHFLKEHEYVISLNLKHYICSRDLWSKLHKRNTDDEWENCDVYIHDKGVLEYIVRFKFDRYIPFDVLLGDYSELY